MGSFLSFLRRACQKRRQPITHCSWFIRGLYSCHFTAEIYGPIFTHLLIGKTFFKYPLSLTALCVQMQLFPHTITRQAKPMPRASWSSYKSKQQYSNTWLSRTKAGRGLIACLMSSLCVTCTESVGLYNSARVCLAANFKSLEIVGDRLRTEKTMLSTKNQVFGARATS